MARDWLQAKEKAAPAEDLRRQLGERDLEIAALKEKFEALEKMVNENAAKAEAKKKG